MVSEDEVTKLANLARLELDPSLVSVVTGHLNSILGYVQRLNEVDTSGIEAMSHVQGTSNVLREDCALEAGTTPDAIPLGDTSIPSQTMLDSDALKLNAPDTSGRFIRVPLIVE